MEFLNSYMPYILAVLAWVPGIIAIIKQQKREKADINKTNVETSSVLIADALRLKDEVSEQFDIIKQELTSNRNELAANRQELESNRRELERNRIELEINKQELKKNKLDIINIKKTVRCLRKGVDILIEQIENMGEVPAWRPDGKIDEPIE